MTNIFRDFQNEIGAILTSVTEAGHLPSGLSLERVTVEPPRDPSHGDLSTNAAMVLSKQAGRKPREIAELLQSQLAENSDVETAEIAGPGFLNLRLTADRWRRELGTILSTGTAYGSSPLGGDQSVNVEYVSANPTGPLHIGHCRGAVFGDALASLLQKVGYRVTKEYVINDAGAQVDRLAGSLYIRYLEALGETFADEAAYGAVLPDGMALEYPGDYLIPAAEALKRERGDALKGIPSSEWLPVARDFAINAMMDLIREDLADLGVRHDVFTSERAITAEGAVTKAVDLLESKGLVYTGVLEPPKGKTPEDWEPRPQLLFKSSAFGDDVDRPLKKSDGSWTYFAGDVGYHSDKIRRGFMSIIFVLGADHGGYLKRMQAAVRALTDGSGQLEGRLCQLVRVMRDGEPVKMSKRAGTFVALSDVVDEVGKDVVRFIMLTRKNDAPLDFDLAKVTEESRDNPVFYVQYAHARCHSVIRNAQNDFPDLDTSQAALAQADFSLLESVEEMALIRQLAAWPRLVESAAEASEPHRIAYYLYDLASSFHSLWTQGKENAHLRFIIQDNPALTLARLALLRSIAFVIASGLDVFGVEPKEELR